MIHAIHLKKTTRHGFTLVELMIVIVLIAILTMITFIAYKGIQDHAKQTVTLNALDQYEQMLRSYKTSNGYYPPTETVALDGSTVITNIGNAAGYVCLGVNGPADPPLAANQCFYSTNTVLNAYENSTIDTALKTMSSTLQNSIGKQVAASDGSIVMRGVVYTSQKRANGTSANTTLLMAPLDSKTCGRGTLDTTHALFPFAVCSVTLN